MNTPLKIVVVDDLPRNITQWKLAVAEDYSITFAPINISSNEELDRGVETLKEKGFLDRSLILLDLGLQDAGLPPFAKSDGLLSKLCARLKGDWSWDKTEGLTYTSKTGQVVNISVDSCDGLALIEVILAAEPRKCLVEIVSGRGENQAVEMLLRDVASSIKSRRRGGSVEFMVGGQMPKQAALARMLVAKGVEEWKRRFPALHGTTVVNDFLTAWLCAYDGLPVNERAHFCAHGTKGAAGTIEGSEQLYKGMLHSVFGIDDELASLATDHDLKSVFQMESRNIAYLTVGSRSLGYGKNQISSALLASVIASLSEMRVEVAGSDKTRLPCQPGLPFLASLLVLFTRMQRQNDGMLDTKSSILLSVAESGPNRISIPLSRRDDFEWKIANRWKEKIESFPTEIAPEPEKKGGVCPALWDVLEARVRGIRFEETSGDEAEKRLIEGKEQLLKIFDGPGRVVAGITFGPYYIHIHW